MFTVQFCRSERGSVGPGTTRHRRAMISNNAGEMSKFVLVGCVLIGG